MHLHEELEADPDIAALHARACVLQEQAELAKKNLLDAIARKSGIGRGSIVKAKGKLYRVAGIDAHFWPVWLWGNPPKKHGGFSNGVHNLFGDWERVSP